MSIATINSNFEMPGICNVYLLPYPTGSYTGADQAAKIKTLYELIYPDGDIRKGTTKASDYFNLTADGLSCKLKSNAVEVDPMLGSKHPSFYQDFSAELEGSFIDVDVNHFKDIISAGSGAIVTHDAATGSAARSTLLIGGQKKINKYALFIRLQSGNGYTGEFDHYVFPRVVFDLDTDLKFEKKSTLECKFKITALYDSTFIDTTTGMPILGFMDTVTGAAL